MLVTGYWVLDAGYWVLDDWLIGLIECNRLQVQGSAFKVKDKEAIKDWKSSLKMLISPNNCQFGSNFLIRPDEAGAFLVNKHLKCSPGTRMEP